MSKFFVSVVAMMIYHMFGAVVHVGVKSVL